MLSIAVDGGLLHPNCRHRVTTYFYDLKEEQGKLEDDGIEITHEEQEYRKNQLRIQQQRRLEEGSLDSKNVAEAKQRREVLVEKDVDLLKRFDGPILDKIYDIYNKATDEKTFVSFNDLDDMIKNQVFDAISSKDSPAKREFINQLSNIRILNKNALGTPHFVIENKKIGIRLNIKEKNIGETLIHEIAHHIDYNLGHNNKAKLMLSDSNFFLTSLQDDWDLFVNDMIKCYTCDTREDFYKIMSYEMKNTKDETYIFASDIIGGLTNNKCVGNSYHEVKY